jgi:hypothetical protein
MNQSRCRYNCQRATETSSRAALHCVKQIVRSSVVESSGLTSCRSCVAVSANATANLMEQQPSPSWKTSNDPFEAFQDHDNAKIHCDRRRGSDCREANSSMRLQTLGLGACISAV